MSRDYITYHLSYYCVLRSGGSDYRVIMGERKGENLILDQSLTLGVIDLILVFSVELIGPGVFPGGEALSLQQK